MQITVTTRHGHVSEETQKRVSSKAEKLLRFFDRLTSIEVVIDLQEPHHPKVQLNATAEHKHDFVSHDDSDNLLTAVESAVQKMEQQLKRHKDRLQHRHRDGSVKREGVALANESPINESAPETNEMEAETE